MTSNSRCRNGRVWVVLAGLMAWPVSAIAQTVPPDAILMPDAKIENAEAARLGRQLFLSVQGLGADGQPSTGQLKIPRLAASLTAVHWLGQEAQDSLSLKIEQHQWIVEWKSRPASGNVIVMSFDNPPKLMSEVQPTHAAGDGSIYLRACEASTTGEKIRYEPQTFKNTVGYWVGKQDLAEWKFEVSETRSYNVGILQGCGPGQGGSRARLTVAADKKEAEQTPAGIAELEFEVLETGGFQHFQWRHLGQITVVGPGTQTLKLEPVEIKKNALMDVRALHLIPLPR